MRSLSLLCVVALVLIGLVGAFGGCAFACHDTDVASAHPDSNCCATVCLCHSVSMAPSSLPTVQPNRVTSIARWHNERLRLPPSVTDIFQPPRV